MQGRNNGRSRNFRPTKRRYRDQEYEDDDIDYYRSQGREYQYSRYREYDRYEESRYGDIERTSGPPVRGHSRQNYMPDRAPPRNGRREARFENRALRPRDRYDNEFRDSEEADRRARKDTHDINRKPSQGPPSLPTGPKSMEKKRHIEKTNTPGPPFKRLAQRVKHKNVMKDYERSNDNRFMDAKPSQPEIIKFMQESKIKGPIYERIQQVGEGTYGKVYKARNRVTGALVALKRLRLETEREGFPITANREIGLLQSFDNKNIVGLSEMMIENNQVFMVFPYMNHDLSGILQQHDITITDGEKKNMFHQLLEGISYLHRKRVIHRDIKGSNILISNKGVLKITDFGLARSMKNIDPKVESPNYTNRVITLWYRPPEILLGSTSYGREIDIWGIGCLLLELFTRRAVFQGTNEVDQLWKIYDIMGTLRTSDWPDADKLPWFEMLRPNYHTESKFWKKFGNLLSPECFNLAKSLLEMNPEKRITAENALKHPYFREEPRETNLEFLKNLNGEWHEFEAKKKRKEREAKEREEAAQQ